MVDYKQQMKFGGKIMNKKIVKLSTILIAVIILCFAASIMSGAVDAEGQCGDNIYWSFNSETGELAFNGSGNMWKYEKSSSVPWYKYSGSITTAKIGKNITSLDVVMTFAECDCILHICIVVSIKSRINFHGTKNIQSGADLCKRGLQKSYGCFNLQENYCGKVFR